MSYRSWTFPREDRIRKKGGKKTVKKLILVVVALVLIASGVAAVSAYEAHLINVRAHVENAMYVTPRHIDFGTVFPEEWLMEEIRVTTSQSFCEEDQLRVTWIDYGVFVEWKPLEGMAFAWDDDAIIANGGQWNQGVGYYNWMGYFTYVGETPLPGPPPTIDQMTLVGDPPAGAPGTAAKWVMDPVAPLHKIGPMINSEDWIWVAIDVPVFEGYYSPLTDALVMIDRDGDGDVEKPSGLDHPTYIIPEDMPGFDADGMDFGLDLKIQVTDISATDPRL
jgi:hypothetical protein